MFEKFRKSNNFKWLGWSAGAVTVLSGLFGIAVSWKSFGFETIAFTSEVSAVEAQYQEAVSYAENTRLLVLYDRLSRVENDLFAAMLQLQQDSTNQLLIQRIQLLRTTVDQLKRQIKQIEEN